MSSSSTNFPNTLHEFPQAANWCSIQRSKAFGLFRHGHVQNIEVATSENGDVIHIRGECLAEMKKNLKCKLNVTMINSEEQPGEITYACCSPCPASKGLFDSSKHLAALCFALEELVRLKQSRDFATCTDRLQTWNQPPKRKLNQDLCMKLT